MLINPMVTGLYPGEEHLEKAYCGCKQPSGDQRGASWLKGCVWHAKTPLDLQPLL